MKKKQIIWIILVLAVVLYSSYFVSAQECMTRTEVEAERTDCLYILDQDVFKKGEYPNFHINHPCGTDITDDYALEPYHQNRPTLINAYLMKPLCQPECSPTDTQVCGTGQLGVCAEGTETCASDGFWGSCISNVNSSNEICNQLDDDCDGSIDEENICNQVIDPDTNADGCIDIEELQNYQVLLNQGQISSEDFLSALNIWFLGCEEVPNSPPTVSISSPTDGQVFTLSDNATINISATDDVGIQKIEMYVNNTLINTDFLAPYSFTITDLIPGTFNIKAMAFDTDGVSTISEVITVYVINVTCIDGDGDGYGEGCLSGLDCNDSDVDVYTTRSCDYNDDVCGDYDLCVASCPDTPDETCNNDVDDDCDGDVDEGCAQDDCMTEEEVKDERSDCLYIYQDDVYKKGSYPNKHQGHECGSDVSNVMEATHIADPGLYLHPNIFAPLCQSECSSGDEESCLTSKKGICSVGKKTCDSRGEWSRCESVNVVVDEICYNNLDDDCDGSIDELCVPETFPVVMISNLFSDIQIVAGEEVKLTAIASDPEGISRVEFYVDKLYVGRDLRKPYEFLWIATQGTHSIITTAIDYTGLSTNSSPKSLTVLSSEGVCIPETEICNGIDDDCDNLIDELDSCILDCLTKDEVEQERTMCLYIYNEEVFRKGLYPNKHEGHECGTDVSNVMQASHIANPAFYLNPNVYKKLCPDYYNRQFIELNLQQNSNNTINLNATSEEEENGVEEEIVSDTYLKLGRYTALIAYFFFALSTFIGVYRVWLIKRTKKRNLVIGYHKATAIIGFVFLFFHVYFLLIDPVKWGNILSLKFVFLPFFSNPTFSYLAFGVFAFYFLVIGVISGILFKPISKSWGYKRWLWIHRLTYLAYGAIFFHALLLGTDFENSFYELFFILFFFLIISKYLDNHVQRKHHISLIQFFETKLLTKQEKVATLTVDHVNYDHSLVGKEVIIDTYLKEYAIRKEVHWFTAFDNTGAIQAYSWKEIPAAKYFVKGILRSYGETLFIEITEITKKS